jgi:arginyl-tRNA synthetase
VMGQEPELAQARLLLYACARDVLGNAMRLLSLTPLTRM